MADERLLHIGLVARETGLTRDVLRKWEDRYGFPRPIRGASGVRQYPESQVVRLREMKRLIDSGHRPASVVLRVQPVHDGIPAATRTERLATGIGRSALVEAMAKLQSHDVSLLRQTLERTLVSLGLARFIAEMAVPLIREVGCAWQQGRLQVYEEHLFSSVLGSVLEGAANALEVSGGSPRIMLTTVPGELHTLGIAMARCLFLESGAHCLCLGAQTPLAEIIAAVEGFRIEILGLSFSEAFTTRQIRPCLDELRDRISPQVEIWIGGAGAARMGRIPPGIRVFADIADAADEIRAVRAGRE